jgi:hypothetical protein
MDTDYYWENAEGPGTVMAADYNLSSPKPLIASTARSGNNLSIFQSGSSCYMWNMMEDSVWQITKPASANDIMQQVKENGVKGLQLKVVERPEGE